MDVPDLRDTVCLYSDMAKEGNLFELRYETKAGMYWTRHVNVPYVDWIPLAAYDGSSGLDTPAEVVERWRNHVCAQFRACVPVLEAHISQMTDNN